MSDFDRCPICRRDFEDCPHSLGQAEEHVARMKLERRIREICREEIIRALQEFRNSPPPMGAPR